MNDFEFLEDEDLIRSEPSIAVLIPCFDEALTIDRVINDYDAALKGHNFKIYVYDNNSKDRTWEVISNNPNCETGKCEVQGKGATIKKMVNEIYADVYVMTDGDDTYPTDKLEYMVELVMDGHYDMVVGQRSNYDKSKQRPFHNFGNDLVNRLLTFKFRHEVRDAMSGLRVMNKKTMKGFAKDMRHNGFELETELTIWCIGHGKKIRYIKTPYKDRPLGSYSKIRTLRDGLKIVWLILKTKRVKYHHIDR